MYLGLQDLNALNQLRAIISATHAAGLAPTNTDVVCCVLFDQGRLWATCFCGSESHFPVLSVAFCYPCEHPTRAAHVSMQIFTGFVRCWWQTIGACAAGPMT